MLSCIWSANIIDIDKKFYAGNGEFHESGKNAPCYGSYGGIGTWGPMGVYYNGIFSRCSDHFASLAIRCIDNSERITNYFNYCDKLLYYYRNDHDPKNGPPNHNLDINKYPSNAPPHWSFFMSNPGGYMPAGEINELHGDEEMDGHGATIVGRWLAWRHLGAPTGGWFTAPRSDVYEKSPWQSSIDSTEFICWLLDYTKRDVVYSEGETTGWCGHGNHTLPGMADETNYAKAALILDKMDDAGILLTNLAKYSYDKNMNYVDKSRGIDWRNFQWIIPEGTVIRADESWYRISDLGNGANQGIALHALELCAGIDDTNPKDLKIIPRVPAPLSGLEITDFPVLIPNSRTNTYEHG